MALAAEPICHTVKIAVSNEKEAAKYELIISRRLETNTSHKGFRFVRSAIDNFEIPGPHGMYLSLLYEPM